MLSSSKPGAMSYREIFTIFLKAGLAFGGGLGILAVLEDELVRKRAVVSQEEFLTDYALGRIVPSGTMTALTVAYGYRLGGFRGTVVALTALVLPAMTTTLALTIGYGYLRDSPLLGWLPDTILPAALAFIAAAALRLVRGILGSKTEMALAAAAFVGAAALHLNPALLLLGGGLAGLILARLGNEARS